VGSLKFDAAARVEERRPLDVPGMLRQLGVPEGARVLLGGSTHPGEETILAEAFLRLRSRYPDLFLVLVPRHFERGREVGEELKRRGVRFVYRSEVTPAMRCEPGTVDCLLVNTTGELKLFYECATVVFVGKSLTVAGGQNPVEPAALAKAIVFGPNMQNFSAIVTSFVREQGAVQVRDAPEFEAVLAELLNDAPRREQLGQNALKVVRENRGAVERTVEMILRHLAGGELYVAPPP